MAEATNFRTYLFAVLLSLTVGFGMFSAYSDVGNTYNNTRDPAYAGFFGNISDSLNKTYSNTTASGREIQTKNLGTLTGEIEVLRIIWQALKNIPFIAYEVSVSIMSAAINLIGIPAWVIDTFITILAILVIALIASSVTRKDS